MKQVCLKVESNIWRLRNHRKSVSAYTMNGIFYAYVFPQFLYGAAVWLFQCFNRVDCYSNENFGYVGVFKKMNSYHVESAKLILGISVNVSHVALLVRIGWIPLKYILAIQSLCWFYRIVNDDRTSIHQLFKWMRLKENDELWGDSLFLKPAYDMIKRLQYVYYLETNIDLDFLDSVNVSAFKRLVTEACFMEVNMFWKNTDDGRFTYDLVPVWKKVKILDQSISRRFESMYYRLSFYQNHLNEFMHRIGKTDKDLCRFCALEKENADHVFLGCEKEDNISLQMECVRQNVKFVLKEILTNEKLKYRTELFVQKYFGKK